MAQRVDMKALSSDMEEGTIVTWKKQEGESVEEGEVLCEVETDKATTEYESPYSGVLLDIVIPEGEVAHLGEPIAVIGEEGEDISGMVEEIGEGTAAVNTRGKVIASPLARSIAETRGIELTNIQGSGPGGRIVKQDVLEANEEKAQPETAGRPSTGTSTAAAEATPGAGESIPLTQKRKIIAQRLSQSKFTSPHFYLTMAVSAEEILKARQKLNASIEGKISFNAYLVKLVAQALEKHPQINATWQDDSITQFSSVNIALAVAQKNGLITPVLRDCTPMGIIEIDAKLRKLIDKARNNKLSQEEYTDAGFTISNLGGYGIDEFTAIINPPGSAILAVGAVKKQPVVDEEEDVICIRKMMNLTLSCDHRVIDGAVGAEFMATLKTMIEEPFSALY